MRSSGFMFVVVGLAAISAACSGVSKMDAAQIATVTDQQVCDPLAQGPVVEREREARGLADCGPGAVECKKMGYRPGGPEYVNCRQMYMQQAVAAGAAYEAARQNAISGVQRAYQPAPSPERSITTCSPAGNGVDVSCSSVTR